MKVGVRSSFQHLLRILILKQTQLDNDGIILWKEAMRNTLSVQSVSGSPALENLLPLAVEQLGQNLDLLGSLLDIMESYFLLDGARILEVGLSRDFFGLAKLSPKSQERAVEVFKAFLSIFDKAAMRENVKSAMKALALLVQITPSNLWGLAMHTSDLFKYLLSTIMEGEVRFRVSLRIQILTINSVARRNHLDRRNSSYLPNRFS